MQEKAKVVCSNYMQPQKVKLKSVQINMHYVLYLRPSNNYRRSSFNINAVVLILIVCKDLRNW